MGLHSLSIASELKGYWPLRYNSKDGISTHNGSDTGITYSQAASVFGEKSSYIDFATSADFDMAAAFSIVARIKPKESISKSSISILVIEAGTLTWPNYLAALGYNVITNTSVTTKAEVDGYNPDIVADTNIYWGVSKGALLNELYDAGYLIFSEGNDTGDALDIISSAELMNTQAGTINLDESHPITENWVSPGNSGSDWRRGITGLNSEAYSIGKDGTLDYYEIAYMEEVGKGRWYHHQPSSTSNASTVVNNGIDFLTRKPIFSKGKGYNFYLRYDNKLYGFANNKSVSIASTVDTTDFYDIALTYDATALKLYVDGVLKDSTAYFTAVSAENSKELFIGPYLNSEVQHLGLFNRALTAEEVKLFSSSAGRPLSGKTSQRYVKV